MLKVMELRRKLKHLKDEGNAVLARTEAEKRARTPEEEARFAAVNKEMDAVDAQMGEYIRVNRISEDMLRTYEPNRPALDQKGSAGPFRSFGEQLIAVADYTRGKRGDNRLFEVRAPIGMGETIPSDGGFLVQTDLIEPILKRMYDHSQVLSRVRRIPVSAPSNSIMMRTVDETSRANGSRWGGIRAYWEAEADSTTATKPKFGRLEMKLEKLMGVCYATEELLSDAAALEAIISEGFKDEFDFKLVDAIIRGTGAGQPLGLLNGGGLTTIAKETGQAADTVVTENVLKMWRALWAPSRPLAVWLYNQELEDQLEMLSVSIGTGGALSMLFTPPTDVNPFGRIKGRPAIPIEQASGPGDVGDIMLVNLGEYLMIDKGGLQAATSVHVQFLTDETTFRFVYRCNGQPMWKSALTPYKRTASTFTVSPYVTLAAR